MGTAIIHGSAIELILWLPAGSHRTQRLGTTTRREGARMSKTLKPVCTRRAPCKSCGAEATLCGLVDFHKSCEDHRRRVLGLSGVPIYYHRCPACRFIFTTAFDHFTKEDFLLHVYNDEYPLVDPDYREARPRSNAAFLCRLFPHARPRRLLDYGGGNGVLVDTLLAADFPHAERTIPSFRTMPTAPRAASTASPASRSSSTPPTPRGRSRS